MTAVMLDPELASLRIQDFLVAQLTEFGRLRRPSADDSTKRFSFYVPLKTVDREQFTTSMTGKVFNA